MADPSALIQVISDHELTFMGKSYRCAVGKKGFAKDKREGDHCSPTGTYSLRECWYRPDRLEAPHTKLFVRPIFENDGWCDASGDANYNQHVKLPYDASHENLWRDDHVYDVIVPLSYNDDPAEAGKGSAIFMHIARPDFSGTEGCVALTKEDLLEVLKNASADTQITILKAD